MNPQKMMSNRIHLKFSSRPQAKVKPADEGGKLIAAKTREREACAIEVTETEFCDERTVGNKSRIFRNQGTLLGDSR